MTTRDNQRRDYKYRCIGISFGLTNRSRAHLLGPDSNASPQSGAIGSIRRCRVGEIVVRIRRFIRALYNDRPRDGVHIDAVFVLLLTYIARVGLVINRRQPKNHLPHDRPRAGPREDCASKV